MLKKLKINGLKCIENISIDFKKTNTIKGKNGVGKTTIKDAISFVLYGKILGTDRLDDAINTKTKKIKVSAIFTIKGKDYVVERSRTTKGSMPSINGRDVEQSDINAIFGTHDEFVSANFVGEFMKYSELDKRSMLSRLFPPIDRSKIFKELTGESPGDLDLENIDLTEKDLRAKVKKIEAERNLLTTKTEMLSMERNNLAARLKEEKEKQHEDVSTELSKTKNALDIISKDEIDKDEFIPEEPDVSDIDQDIEDKNNQLTEILRKVPNDYILKEKESKIKALKAEADSIKSSTHCPTCKRKLDNAEQIKSSALAKENEAITIYKSYLKDKTEYETASAAYEESITSLRSEIATLQEERKKKLLEYNVIKDENNKEYLKKKEERQDKIDQLRRELDLLSRKESDYKMHKLNIDRTIEQMNDIDIQINAITEQIKNKGGKKLENMLKAFGPKGIKFQEVLSQQKAVNKLLPKGLSIQFMKENKTNDGFKTAFDVIYNGIGYNWLSTGMQLGVDMHLIKLFDKHSLMIVIDNFESYTGGIPSSLKDKQLLKLVAHKGDLLIT